MIVSNNWVSKGDGRLAHSRNRVTRGGGQSIQLVGDAFVACGRSCLVRSRNVFQRKRFLQNNLFKSLEDTLYVEIRLKSFPNRVQIKFEL